jgi:hypothetical protein
VIDTDQRLRAVEDAVTRMAGSVERMEGYMQQLTAVAVRQEEHAKAVDRAFTEIADHEKRLQVVEKEQAELSGAIKFVKWATGVLGFTGIAAVLAALFGAGKGG